MRSVYIVLALLIAFTLVSCDEGIDPILETDRQFTLFGALDMAQDTQFVRVIEIRPTLTTPGEKPVSYTHLRAPRDRTRSRMPSSA